MGCNARSHVQIDWRYLLLIVSIQGVVEAEAVANPAEGSCGYISYRGPPWGAAYCFGQLARNAGCPVDPPAHKCTCPEGCDISTVGRGDNLSITFPNFHHASGCRSPTALLTIPRSAVANIQVLFDDCSAAPMQTALRGLLQKGFSHYQELVSEEAVLQCIHAAQHISVPWLHLHTVCEHGRVDWMPSGNEAVSHCERMSSVEEADVIASRFVAWARRLQASDPVPSQAADQGVDLVEKAHTIYFGRIPMILLCIAAFGTISFRAFAGRGLDSGSASTHLLPRDNPEGCVYQPVVTSEQMLA